MQVNRLSIWIAVLPAALPAIADDVAEQIESCATIEADDVRLRCYDQVAGGVSQSALVAADKSEREDVSSTPERTPVPPPPAKAPPVADTDVERFSLDISKDDVKEIDQISGRIVEIVVQTYGERLVTLDNGQVWREKSAHRGLTLDVGDTVTIKSGLFGSFRLFGSGKKSSGVTRVR